MIRAILGKIKRFFLRHAGIVALTEAHATARAEVSTLASALGEVKSLLAGVTGGLAELSARFGEGEAALGEVKASLREGHAALGEMKASLREGHAAVGEVKASLREAHVALRETKAIFRETRTAFGEVKASLSEGQAALGEMHTALAPMKVSLEETADTVGKVNIALEGLRNAQLAAAQATAAQLAAAQTTAEQTAAAQQELVKQLRPMLEGQSELLRQLVEQSNFLAACHHRLNEEQTLNRLAIDNRLAAMYAQLVHVEAFYRILSQLTAAMNRPSSVETDLGVDKWKFQEYEGLLRYFRKKDYLQAIDSGKVPVPRLETEHPIAAASNDTRFPRGAKNDNSICLRFNRKLYAFLGDKPAIKVLDLGCAGGGFVRSLLDDGHFAVGLDGCPYPKLNQVGEWATIPQHLYTCDITQPFTLRDDATGEILQFDAITAWELMEHIPEEGLPTLLANIDRHLAPGGTLLFSIATFVDKDDEIGVVWHVTVKARDWWVARFMEAGFVVEEQSILDKDDWLRGSGNCRGDWHEDDNLGFHLVLRRREMAARAAA